MKVLVYSKVKIKRDTYEAMRLRKNIKGALEQIGLPYVESVFDKYDVAHFLSIKDEKKINDVKENVPTVFSALYTENDECSKITTIDKNGNKILKSKALRVLNSVDCVLVPGENAKEYLLKQGVTSRIEVMSSGVNFNRFIPHNESESEMFWKYFSKRESNNIVLCNGSYEKIDEINSLLDIARRCKFLHFFFFGDAENAISSRNTIAKLNKIKPDNLFFAPILDDDVYRSSMMAANYFLCLSEDSAETISTIEAMASKAQIVALAKSKKDSYLVNGENAYLCDSPNQIATVLIDLYEKKLESTVTKAYNKAKKYSLLEVGKQLNNLYGELIKNKGGNKNA